MQKLLMPTVLMEVMSLGEVDFQEDRFEEYPVGPKLNGHDIEIRNDDISRGRARFVLFDFDGTISLIRAGWQDVMIPMMVQILADLETDETEQELYELVEEYVVKLTGKQTIYQMMRLAEEVRKRGGEPDDPVEYKNEYLRRLSERIRGRKEGLESGKYDPQQMRVPGSKALVEDLYNRGMELYLASGTDIEFVRQETELIEIAEYFDDRIYGALDEYENFSKKMIIKKIFEDNDLHGPELLSFGDGYVEILNTREVGGVAVGAATDEYEREGINDWRRNRLIQAGADLIVPEFREHDALVRYLMMED